MIYYIKDGYENFHTKKIFGFLEFNINLTLSLIDCFILKKKIGYINFFEGKAYLNIRFIKLKIRIPAKKVILKILSRYIMDVISMKDKKNNQELINIIAFFDRTGETYLNCLHIREYIKEHGITSWYIITPFQYLIELIKIFNHNVEIIKVPQIFYQLHFFCKSVITFNDINVHQVLFHNHFLDFEKKIRAGEDVYFYGEILKRLNIKKINEITPIVFSDNVKDNAENKLHILGLQGKEFMIIAPEAQSNGTLTDLFWQNLSLHFLEKGIEVLFNVTKNTATNQYGKTSYFTLSEAMYIASKSKLIVGIRSGFMDLISYSGVPICCIYYPFSYRCAGLPYLSANNVMKSYSLKKLPLVCKDRIEEIDGELLSEDDILENIYRYTDRFFI